MKLAYPGKALAVGSLVRLTPFAWRVDFKYHP